MKLRLLIILTLWTATPSFGQKIKGIIFTSQQIDEPPTKSGRPKYSIEFNRQSNGDLIAIDYFKDKKKKKLENKTVIDKGQLEKIIEWGTNDTETFTLSDLGLNIQDLKSRASGYNLNFEIPTDFVVRVDSFQFCRTYKMVETVRIGGEIITVAFIIDKGEKSEMVFESGDIVEGKFKLKEYILFYTLLKDKIPSEISYNDFFSQAKLIDIVLQYQKTVECEGYYYKEYTEMNPQLTPQEKRMRKDWNFVEYLGQRKRKK